MVARLVKELSLSLFVKVFKEVLASEQARAGEWSFTLPAVGPSDAPLNLSLGLDVDESLLVEAANNMCVCAMYKCTTAVSALEELVQEDPVAHMCDVVVFNLCTMHELSCDNGVN